MRQLVLIFCTFFLSLAQAQTWTGEGEVDYTAMAFAQQLQELRSGERPAVELVRIIFDSAQITLVKNGSPVSWNNGQGLRVDEWNLEALRNTYTNGVGLTLDHLLSILYLSADGVKRKMPEAATVDPIFKQKFLEDLKRMTELPESDQTGLRFMSHLIVLIGLNSSTPYNLLDPKVSGSVRLDPIQSFLLLHRMAAELHVFANKFKPKSFASPVKLKSSLRMNASCQMTEIEGLIMDASATGSGMILGGVQFFQGALERLADAKYLDDVGVQKYQEMSQVANIISNYAKLLITMAAFKSELTQEPRPLVRTKNKTPGGNGKVNGRFWLDVGDYQFVNCIRPALNVFGLDFSVPQSGALAGVRAEWAINSRVTAENDVIQTYDIDPLRQVTDEEGKSFVKIQGKPQKKDLTASGRKLIRVDRYVPVNVAVNLKNNNMGQDMIDLAGGAGGVSALWTLPVELLNRIPFLFNRTLNVKVTDWKELEGDHFQIHATYSGNDIREPWDAFKRNISDRVLIDIEVKVIANTQSVISNVLSIEDDKTSFNHEYKAEFYAGEGCIVKRRPLGQYEVFTHLPSKTNVSSANLGGSVKVIFNSEGLTDINGWSYEADHPSCQLQGINPYTTTQPGSQLYFEFNSNQINRIGQTITQDRRNSNGEGWVFDITYVE